MIALSRVFKWYGRLHAPSNCDTVTKNIKGDDYTTKVVNHSHVWQR